MKMVDSVEGRERKVRIALDFDGVLHSYRNGYTGEIPLDPPVEGAQLFCEMLLERGYEVVIFTTRAHPNLAKSKLNRFVELVRYDDATDSWESTGNRGLTLGTVGIRQWLKHWNFPARIINAQITHKKEHADLFVDDRGFRFEGNFGAVLSFLDDNPHCLTWTKSQ